MSQRELQRQKALLGILVVVSVRYSMGWIQGRAKIGRGRASLLTKSSFRPNVHGNILMYCRRHMHLFEYRHSGYLFFWLNCLLLVIRWAIKGTWASSCCLLFTGCFLLTKFQSYTWLHIDVQAAWRRSWHTIMYVNFLQLESLNLIHTSSKCKSL